MNPENGPFFRSYPFGALGSYTYILRPVAKPKIHIIRKGLNPNPVYQSKERPQFSMSPDFQLMIKPKIDALNVANKRPFCHLGTHLRKRECTATTFGLCADSDGQRGTERKRTLPSLVHRLASPVSWAWRLPKRPIHARHGVFRCISRRARKSFQRWLRSPTRGVEAIRGCPCMLADGFARVIGNIECLKPTNSNLPR